MKTLDTNVLVYSIDTSEPTKRQQAIKLIGELTDQPETPSLLWQVAV
jgi:predicted nucleic acid-binding protein